MTGTERVGEETWITDVTAVESFSVILRVAESFTVVLDIINLKISVSSKVFTLGYARSVLGHGFTSFASETLGFGTSSTVGVVNCTVSGTGLANHSLGELVELGIHERGFWSTSLATEHSSTVVTDTAVHRGMSTSRARCTIPEFAVATGEASVLGGVALFDRAPSATSFTGLSST